MREQLLDGADPIELRRQKRAADRRAPTKHKTFAQAAEEYIELHRSTWRSDKHARQWARTLEHYAYPVLGKMPLADIDTPMILSVLMPIWSSRPETASRVRGRLEAILDGAKVAGFREGENPARLRGHLDKLLPRLSRTKAAVREERGRGAHHPALPHVEVPAFWQQLKTKRNVAAAVLRFLILTAARTKETRLAQWREIDLEGAMWTKPASHTKAGKDHRVPLSAAALTVLREMQQLNGGDPKPDAYVFPGRGGSPLSPNAIGAFLHDMRPSATVHGMRATFSTWAADRRFDHNVVEAALAHEIGTAVSRAYQHSDLFDLRRQLAEEWAEYCAMASSAELY
jgi:integrase